MLLGLSSSTISLQSFWVNAGQIQTYQKVPWMRRRDIVGFCKCSTTTPRIREKQNWLSLSRKRFTIPVHHAVWELVPFLHG